MSASAPESPVELAGAAFRALRRGITRSRGFSLHVCTCDSSTARDQWIRNLAASLPHVAVHSVTLGDGDDDVLEAVLHTLRDRPPGPVMVLGLGAALRDEARAERLLGALNLRRADWPSAVPQAVVFWISRQIVGQLTAGAPDFFDWRSDTLDFPDTDLVPQRPFAAREWEYGIDPRFTRAEQEERVLELRARLASSSGVEEESVLRSRLAWWDELADMLMVRGELDEALRIRTQEQLPVYERLGDVREKAVTQGKIADILQARGQLDEALRIRTQEQLPVYERLGDVRSLLVGRTNLALLLAQRGKPEDRREILALLYWSLVEATRRKLPEARTISDILQQMGIATDELGDALTRFKIDPERPLH